MTDTMPHVDDEHYRRGFEDARVQLTGDVNKLKNELAYARMTKGERREAQFFATHSHEIDRLQGELTEAHKTVDANRALADDANAKLQRLSSDGDAIAVGRGWLRPADTERLKTLLKEAIDRETARAEMGHKDTNLKGVNSEKWDFRNCQLTDENLQIHADILSTKTSYQQACELVAAMHAAVMGEVCAPKLGVVEDVADFRARCLCAEKDVAEVKVKTQEQEVRVCAVEVRVEELLREQTPGNLVLLAVAIREYRRHMTAILRITSLVGPQLNVEDLASFRELMDFRVTYDVIYAAHERLQQQVNVLRGTIEDMLFKIKSKNFDGIGVRGFSHTQMSDWGRVLLNLKAMVDAAQWVKKEDYDCIYNRLQETCNALDGGDVDFDLRPMNENLPTQISNLLSAYCEAAVMTVVYPDYDERDYELSAKELEAQKQVTRWRSDAAKYAARDTV